MLPKIEFPDGFKKVKHTQFPFVRVVKAICNDWSTQKVCIGIDPGVNFGITFIYGNEIEIWNGHLPKEGKPTPWEYGYEAYDFLNEALKNYVGRIAVVEGAAYRDTYGQVGLESVRFAYYLALAHNGWEVTIKPPMSIRKTIFGDGRIFAGNEWPLLNDNAADSLAIALYARQLGE